MCQIWVLLVTGLEERVLYGIRQQMCKVESMLYDTQGNIGGPELSCSELVLGLLKCVWVVHTDVKMEIEPLGRNRPRIGSKVTCAVGRTASSEQDLLDVEVRGIRRREHGWVDI